MGTESPNFQDQAELYAAWRFHDNALTGAELTNELAGDDCKPASFE